MSKQFFQRFLNDERGANIIEFAFVAPVFFLLFLGILEFGLYMFHRIAVEAITMQAARESSLGKSNSAGPCAGTADRASYMRCVVQQKSKSLIRGDDTIVQINTLANGGTFLPDICLFDPQKPSSAPAVCGPGNVGPFEEVNGATGYQGASAAAAVGNAGDVVEVRVIYPWKVLIPYLAQYFGSADGKGGTTGVVMISARTVFKNEPF